MLLVLLLNGTIVCSFNKCHAETNSTIQPKQTESFRYAEADDCTCDLYPCICGGRNYLGLMTKRIFGHWNPPQPNNEKILVGFKVQLNGDISNLHLISGKNVSNNKIALNAIRESAPFYALPENATEEIDVRFEFPSIKKPAIPNRSTRASKLDEKIKTYLYFLQKILRSNWRTSNCNLGYGIAVIDFDFNRDGTISNCLIQKKSGSASFDKEVLKIVNSSSPVPIAPGLTEKMKCEFTFDSNMNRCYLSKVMLNKF